MNNYLCVHNFSLDFNGDRVITISDISSSIGYWLKVPGRFFIQTIHGTDLGIFFELDYSSCDNWVSIAFSFLIWLWLVAILTKLR